MPHWPRGPPSHKGKKEDPSTKPAELKTTLEPHNCMVSCHVAAHVTRGASPSSRHGLSHHADPIVVCHAVNPPPTGWS